MDRNFIVHREKDKKVADGLIEDNFKLYLGELYLANVGYRYQQDTGYSNGLISFNDKSLSIFYGNGVFSNGLCAGDFVKPAHTIEAIVNELTQRKLDSLGLKNRICYLQEFLRIQDNELLDIYKEFLDIK